MIDPMTSRLAHVWHQEQLQAAAQTRQHRAMSAATGKLIDRLRLVTAGHLKELNQRMRASMTLAKV